MCWSGDGHTGGGRRSETSAPPLWKRRPDALRLLYTIRNPLRGFDAVIIGEPQRAFYGSQFSMTFPIFIHPDTGPILVVRRHSRSRNHQPELSFSWRSAQSGQRGGWGQPTQLPGRPAPRPRLGAVASEGAMPKRPEGAPT